jgi:hypothetical protein
MTAVAAASAVADEEDSFLLRSGCNADTTGSLLSLSMAHTVVVHLSEARARRIRALPILMVVGGCCRCREGMLLAWLLGKNDRTGEERAIKL